ncbi:MAG: mechanosensitive ion channel domain-containing protein [Oscillospiraceae bacterium]|jgi:small conductance mechanosensitive channel
MEKMLEALKDFLPSLAAAVAVLVGGLLMSKICIKIMSKGLSKSKMDPTAHSFLKSLVRVVLYSIVIVISLSLLGIPTTSIIAVIGAAGLAIGLALQNSMSNVAGGFIILFSKPFKVGDYIETNSVQGTVQAISILYTRLLTFDNKAVYIPNGQISSSTLVNYTEEELRRLDLVFSISYSDDFEKAKNVILGILSKNQYTLSVPEPLVRVSAHEASSISIAVKVWVKSVNYWALNWDLHESVKTSFDKEGITIPFNQLDVNIKK